jgi:hypothetical protein
MRAILQAAEHRREERTAKRLALDLAVLEPFLEQVRDPGPLLKRSRAACSLRSVSWDPRTPRCGRSAAR